jgi:hypothetical protein
VRFRDSPAFQRDVSPLSSGSSKKLAEAGNKLNCLHYVPPTCRALSEHGVTEADNKHCSACHLLLLISCLAYSSALKMAVLLSSKTWSFLWPTWHYNPEDHTFQWGKVSHWHTDWLIYISNLWVYPTSTLKIDTAYYWNVGFLHNTHMAECLRVFLPIFVSWLHNFTVLFFFLIQLRRDICAASG